EKILCLKPGARRVGSPNAGAAASIVCQALCNCRSGLCAGYAIAPGEARAHATLQFGEAISIGLTGSMPTTKAGARKIRILSCGCCARACAERTAFLQPA